MRIVPFSLAILPFVACHFRDDVAHDLHHANAHIRVTEASATPTSEFSSAAVVSDTSAITWSEDKPYITVSGRHGSNRHSLTAVVVGVGSGDHAGVTEMLDSNGRILLIDEFGRIRPGGRILLNARPHVAIGNGAQWFVVLDEPDGPALLKFSALGSEPSWRVKIPVSPRVLRASGGRIRLLRNLGNVTVLSSLPPFDVLTYSASGALIARLRLADEQVIQRVVRQNQTESANNWRLVAGVEVDSLVLLTLSDLNSDRRVLVLADPKTGIQSIKQISVPLAIVAGDHKWLLAGRRTDRFELVRYEWGWDHLLEEER